MRCATMASTTGVVLGIKWARGWGMVVGWRVWEGRGRDSVSCNSMVSSKVHTYTANRSKSTLEPCVSNAPPVSYQTVKY